MIKLTGRALYVSREQVRAFLYATLLVLAYHNRDPVKIPLVVRIRKHVVYNGQAWAGLHCAGDIELRSDLSLETMLTTCVHEVIHACIRFPEGTIEKNTSTLCARIKPDVARLADVLLENTYRRAAYIAHTKMTYRPDREDHYDNEQYAHVGVMPRYHRGETNGNRGNPQAG